MTSSKPPSGMPPADASDEAHGASGSRPTVPPGAATGAGAWPGRESEAAGPGRNPSRPPGSPETEARYSRPPREHHDDRSPFDRILPELLKRGLEASRGTIGNVSDTLFSRDLAASVVSQLGDMREGVVSAVAQEVGRFLRQADIAAEIRNVLTGMEVEANVKIKFRKSESGGITTEVEVEDPPRRGRR